ncbi:MAG: DMT family transporter [Pseudomonadota bacterium]
MGKDAQVMNAGLLRPVLLLVATGVLGGTSMLLVKLGSLAGIPAVSYLFWQCLGAGIVLLVIAGLRGNLPSFRPLFLRYYLIASLFSLVIPMGLGYFMVPFLGASLAGVFMALPPLMTYLISMGVGLERAQIKRLLGLAVGFLGVLVLYVPHINAPDSTILVYLLVAAIIPVSLAAANVYRTVAWPAGGMPMALASGMMLAGAVLCLGFEMARDRLHVPALADNRAWIIILTQMGVASLMYVCHFELQRVAGPVFLSQIGYVMALTSLAGGTLLLGEGLRPELLVTLGCVVAGTFLVRPVKPANAPT